MLTVEPSKDQKGNTVLESGIYVIVNKVNQKKYIGQSVNIKRRFMEHRTPKNRNKNLSIARAIKKYGANNFDFNVLEYCGEDELNQKEMQFISALKPEYNRSAGGLGARNHRVTEEVKSLLRSKGKNQWSSYTEEQKANIIANNLIGRSIGYKQSEATKAKLREHFSGKKLTQEHVRNISNALKGKSKPNLFNYRKVKCISKETNKTICVYDSITIAAKKISLSPSSISGVLAGRRKTAGGFYWEYYSSVETIGDECSRVGRKMSSRSKCEATQWVDDIVHPYMIEKCRINDKGYIQLAMRTGQYRTINTAEVFKGEIKKINRFTGEIEFNEDAEIGGDVVGYLAYFKLINGFEKYFYMSKAEMLIHAKRFSKMYSKKESKLTGIWAEDFDTMSKKTVLKLLLSKYGILSIELQTALQSDQAVVTTDEKSGEIHYEFVENEEEKPEEVKAEEIVNEEAEITSVEIIKRIREIKSKFELTAWTKKHSAEIESFTNGEFVDIQNALEEKKKELK